MKALISAALSLIITHPVLAGNEAGGGDPVSFEMPSVNFAYQCELTFRGRENRSRGFYWAKRKITVPKSQFNTGDSAAIYRFARQSQGWDTKNESGQTANELPSFLQAYEVRLYLIPAANAGLQRKGYAINVQIEGLVPAAHGSVASYSTYQDFGKSNLFSTSVEFRPVNGDTFVSWAAECRRVH